MIDAVLAYAAAGYRVLPCTPEKRPLVRWSTEATTAAAVIAGWWRRWPDALVALCTGDQGLVVVDDDRGLVDPDPIFPTTLTARTRTRGRHHYYVSPVPQPSTVGTVLAGVDTRGVGGYVIAPPSPGWAWENEGTPIAPLPAWIADATRAAATTARRFEYRQHVGEGERNDHMASFVGHLIRQGTESLAELVDEAQQYNALAFVPPLDDAELRQVCRSILRTHNRR